MSQLLVYYLATIILINLSVGHGLTCYKCTTSDPLSGCVMNNGRPVECTENFCTLYRIESSDAEPPFYLNRGCQKLPSPPNVSSNYDNHEQKVYFRYCSTDLCNAGDGINNQISRPPINVPGMNSSATRFLSANLYLFISIVILQMFLISKESQ